MPIHSHERPLPPLCRHTWLQLGACIVVGAATLTTAAISFVANWAADEIDWTFRRAR